MLEEVVSKLSKLYSPLSTETVDGITQSAEILSVNKGHELVRAGQLSDKIFYIIKGGVKVFFTNPTLNQLFYYYKHRWFTFFKYKIRKIKS